MTNLDQDGPDAACPAVRPDAGGLDAALDALRERYGTTAIKRAALLNAGEELTPWLMPGGR